MMADTIAAMPHIRSGRLKAIALGSVDAKTFLPDVQAISEQGFPEFSVSSWSGVVVPNDTPVEIIDRLESDLKAALADEDTKAQVNKIGAVVTFQPRDEMTARLKAEYERWSQVVKDNNISNS